jgi:hypothetical protein
LILSVNKAVTERRQAERVSSLLPSVGRRLFGLLFPEGGQGRARRNAEGAVRAHAAAHAEGNAAARDRLASP